MYIEKPSQDQCFGNQTRERTSKVDGSMVQQAKPVDPKIILYFYNIKYLNYVKLSLIYIN